MQCNQRWLTQYELSVAMADALLLHHKLEATGRSYISMSRAEVIEMFSF